ncbi:MAG: chemotaxis protein CheB [Gaiellales bacterium]
MCIGCSWGGLHALQILLGGLDSSFPLPICIVQHRSAQADQSLLAPLIAASTRLEVAEAEDKVPLEPGTVYIAPGGYHLLVEDGHTALSVDDLVRWARPSVDVLFDSASIAYGPQVIAVVLTGANDDGARGARTVQDAGGAVIVQDPQSAERAEMPQAVLDAVTPDAILPLEMIAGELVRRAKGVTRT